MMMGMPVMMVCAGGKRQEDTFDPLEVDAFAFEQLHDGRIFRHTHRCGEHLYAKVKITQTPGDAGGLLERGDRNFQHFLRFLAQIIALLTFDVKERAVLERLVEIEAKFAAVRGNTPPASFCQRRPAGG